MDQEKKIRVGDIVREYNLITEEQLNLALAESKKTGKRLGEALISLGLVTEGQLNWALSHHLNIPLIENLDFNTLDLDLIRSIPPEVLLTYRVLPLAILDDEIAVAMADPTDSKAIERLESITGRKVRPSIASAGHISAVFSELFTLPEQEYRLESKETRSPGVPRTHFDLKENFSGSSFLNFHLTQAISEDAEEIHIDPLEEALWVRYRVKGTLEHKSKESLAFHGPVLQQLRILGRLPTLATSWQKAEAKIQSNDREFYLDISIFPTQRGEAAWIKILKEPLKLEENQLPSLVTTAMKKFSSRSNGLWLVTGSFPSERNFILSELMKQLESPARKIMVLEKNAFFSSYEGRQVVVPQLKESSDEKALEELLSLNPEVLVLAEPEIFWSFLTPALWEAAASSTLVIGTLRCKDSGEAMERLLQKIQPIVLNLTLRYIIAGNRFKRLCEECRESYLPSAEIRTFLNLAAETRLYRTKGCGSCNFTGLNGVLKLYELLEMDQEIHTILQDTALTGIRKAILDRIGNSIEKQALQKLKEGLLSEEEVILKILN
jgi:type II secretory ATPase GspE/PulE/Tfp pilus assembly ATPase PilB-like protein